MPSPRAVMPSANDPHCMRMWRIDPIASHPNPASAPDPIARHPDVTRAGRYYDGFDRRRWRGLLHDNLCWLRRRGAGGVDHEINHLLADAAVVQVHDVRCAQLIVRVRSADLADDDLVAHAGFRHRLDVRHAQ